MSSSTDSLNFAPWVLVAVPRAELNWVNLARYVAIALSKTTTIFSLCGLIQFVQLGCIVAGGFFPRKFVARSETVMGLSFTLYSFQHARTRRLLS